MLFGVVVMNFPARSSTIDEEPSRSYDTVAGYSLFETRITLHFRTVSRQGTLMSMMTSSNKKTPRAAPTTTVTKQTVHTTTDLYEATDP
jgi:hypothetical protein